MPAFKPQVAPVRQMRHTRGMRLGFPGVLIGWCITGCAPKPPPPPPVELAVRVVDNGVASDFATIGTVGANGSVGVCDTSFELKPRSPEQGIAFGPGCFLLQVDREPKPQLSAVPDVLVAESRSLFERRRGLPDSPELVPLVSPLYNFAGLGAAQGTLGLFAFGADSIVASQFGVMESRQGEEGSVLRVSCSVQDVAMSEAKPLSVEVVGAGRVRVGSPENPFCTQEDESSCHQLASGETTIRLERLPGSDDRIPLSSKIVSGCTVNGEQRSGDVLVVAVEPGRCTVDFGEETWDVEFDIRTLGLQVEPRSMGEFTPSGAGSNRFRIPSSIFVAHFIALVDGRPEAVRIDGPEECRLGSSGDGTLVVRRPDDVAETVICRISSADSQPVALDLGDSRLPVRVEPLGVPGQGRLVCASEDEQTFGPCRDETDAVLVPSDRIELLPNQQVRLVALAAEAEFTCSAEKPTPSADGFPSVTVQMPAEGLFSCAITPPASGDAQLSLVFNMSTQLGEIIVAEGAKPAESCSSADRRWCEFEVSEESSIEFRGLPGISSFSGVLENLTEDANMAYERPPERMVNLTCEGDEPEGPVAMMPALVPDGSPGMFRLDPVAVVGMRGNGRVQLACEPQYTCLPDASFEGATLDFVDGGGAIAGSIDYAPDDCTAAATPCEAKAVILPPGTYNLKVRFTGPARLIATPRGFDGFLDEPTYVFGNDILRFSESFTVPNVAKTQTGLRLDFLSCLRDEGWSSLSAIVETAP